MSARVPLFFTIALIFAFLPTCKKPAPPSETVAKAEGEIRKAATEIGYRSMNLEDAEGAGRIAVLTQELEELKNELHAIREKNEALIPMERSKEIANAATEEAKRTYKEEVRRIEGK